MNTLNTKQLTKDDLTKQVENLVRYLLQHPEENFTIISETIQNAHGDCIATFNNHLQAMTALRVSRENLFLVSGGAK